MPIRPELRHLYPANWHAISERIRFARARGACEGCGRPHGHALHVLPGGRWFDPIRGSWRDRRGRDIGFPDLLERLDIRTTRVVLATAHLDHDPRHNSARNLRALCQRCHLLHDRAHHTRQRALTIRRRSALADLFEGLYDALLATAERRGPRIHGATIPTPHFRLPLHSAPPVVPRLPGL